MNDKEIFTRVYVPEEMLKEAVKDLPQKLESVIDDCKRMVAESKEKLSNIQSTQN